MRTLFTMFIVLFCTNVVYAESCINAHGLKKPQSNTSPCAGDSSVNNQTKSIENRAMQMPLSTQLSSVGNLHRAASLAIVPETAPPSDYAFVRCQSGYEPRLAQAQDFTCVSHHIAMRTAMENSNAFVAGKPNPMTTNLDGSCKSPSYYPRRATADDNVCVHRASYARAQVDNDNE